MTPAQRIMAQLGYPETEHGPFVTELRKHIQNRVDCEGLVGMSPGTWSGEPTSYEERAKAQLAFDWEVANRHSHRVECIDGLPIRWRYDIANWPKRRLEVRWSKAPAWIGDVLRKHHCRLRVWWDRAILRKRNPYL